jgi:hydroxyethylthiazole kinase-like sugar kinase family protein
MCRAGHQLENRVVIAREALRILALGVLSVMATTSAEALDAAEAIS